MRVLSARMTTQPQRWTTVPAVAMTAAGAGLLAFSPQDGTLTTLNWVWPPAMLALSVWAFISMRRVLTGRGRWLLTPVPWSYLAADVGRRRRCRTSPPVASRAATRLPARATRSGTTSCTST